MALHLLSLPEELVLRIVQCIAEAEHVEDGQGSLTCGFAKRSLRALQGLRLSCRTLCHIATPVLFERVGLYPCQDSRKRYLQVLENDTLRKYVHDVHINTIEEDEEADWTQEELPISKRFMHGLRRVHEFPHLKAVTLRFSPNCSSYNIYHSWPQSSNLREPILQGFFATVAKTTITDLSLLNLQNINDQMLLRSAAFHKVMNRLTSLTLQICTEEDQAAPEHSIEYQALHTFFPALPRTWLAPAAATLTHLTLYSDCYIGWCPSLDLTSLDLPRMTSLALGRYTFTSSAPLAWLARHASTLTHLTLHDCPILVYRVVASPLRLLPNSDSATVPPRVGGTGRGRPPPHALQYTELRWSEVFARLGEALPRLRVVRVSSERWRRESLAAAREGVENLRCELSAGRYAWYCSGYRKSHGMWMGATLRGAHDGRDAPEEKRWMQFAGRCGVEMDGEQGVEDVEALRKLMVRIGMRREGFKPVMCQNAGGKTCVRF
ncbi:hypothetical protein B0J12DRAFT_70959 [Macrophomina phaseolina]|uniref:F-box domain-containing protein n=1 Tax=Macrophomina phaseolina TaxID=35725 RepID=A0ABQ8GDG7_9PEZI|nr:hypothetical protein B0J12DRAFT_70959 [Macrophomina phaseolina]